MLYGFPGFNHVLYQLIFTFLGDDMKFIGIPPFEIWIRYEKLLLIGGLLLLRPTLFMG